MKIIFKSIKKIDEFITNLNEVIDTYGYATVEDAYELLNLRSMYNHRYSGWIKPIKAEELEVNLQSYDPLSQQITIKVKLPKEIDLSDLIPKTRKHVQEEKEPCAFCGKTCTARRVVYTISVITKEGEYCGHADEVLNYCPVCGRKLSE